MAPSKYFDSSAKAKKPNKDPPNEDNKLLDKFDALVEGEDLLDDDILEIESIDANASDDDVIEPGSKPEPKQGKPKSIKLRVKPPAQAKPDQLDETKPTAMKLRSNPRKSAKAEDGKPLEPSKATTKRSKSPGKSNPKEKEPLPKSIPKPSSAAAKQTKPDGFEETVPDDKPTPKRGASKSPARSSTKKPPIAATSDKKPEEAPKLTKSNPNDSTNRATKPNQDHADNSANPKPQEPSNLESFDIKQSSLTSNWRRYAVQTPRVNNLPENTYVYIDEHHKLSFNEPHELFDDKFTKLSPHETPAQLMDITVQNGRLNAHISSARAVFDHPHCVLFSTALGVPHKGTVLHTFKVHKAMGSSCEPLREITAFSGGYLENLKIHTIDPSLNLFKGGVYVVPNIDYYSSIHTTENGLFRDHISPYGLDHMYVSPSVFLPPNLATAIFAANAENDISKIEEIVHEFILNEYNDKLNKLGLTRGRRNFSSLRIDAETKENPYSNKDMDLRTVIEKYINILNTLYVNLHNGLSFENALSPPQSPSTFVFYSNFIESFKTKRFDYAKQLQSPDTMMDVFFSPELGAAPELPLWPGDARPSIVEVKSQDDIPVGQPGTGRWSKDKILRFCTNPTSRIHAQDYDPADLLNQGAFPGAGPSIFTMEEPKTKKFSLQPKPKKLSAAQKAHEFEQTVIEPPKIIRNVDQARTFLEKNKGFPSSCFVQPMTKPFDPRILPNNGAENPSNVPSELNPPYFMSSRDSEGSDDEDLFETSSPPRKKARTSKNQPSPKKPIRIDDPPPEGINYMGRASTPPFPTKAAFADDGQSPQRGKYPKSPHPAKYSSDPKGVDDFPYESYSSIQRNHGTNFNQTLPENYGAPYQPNFLRPQSQSKFALPAVGFYNQNAQVGGETRFTNNFPGSANNFSVHQSNGGREASELMRMGLMMTEKMTEMLHENKKINEKRLELEQAAREEKEKTKIPNTTRNFILNVSTVDGTNPAESLTDFLTIFMKLPNAMIAKNHLENELRNAGCHVEASLALARLLMTGEWAGSQSDPSGLSIYAFPVSLARAFGRDVETSTIFEDYANNRNLTSFERKVIRDLILEAPRSIHYLLEQIKSFGTTLFRSTGEESVASKSSKIWHDWVENNKTFLIDCTHQVDNLLPTKICQQIHQTYNNYYLVARTEVPNPKILDSSLVMQQVFAQNLTTTIPPAILNVLGKTSNHNNNKRNAISNSNNQSNRLSTSTFNSNRRNERNNDSSTAKTVVHKNQPSSLKVSESYYKNVIAPAAAKGHVKIPTIDGKNECLKFAFLGQCYDNCYRLSSHRTVNDQSREHRLARCKNEAHNWYKANKSANAPDFQ